MEILGCKGDQMSELQQKLEYVRGKIEGKVNHPFLSQHINVPDLDEDKLLFLVSILDYADLPMEDIENYAISAMLLDIALETHDQVTNDMSGEENLRVRQLTVLAGTYYSGLYYQLLSRHREIDVIRLLALAIETINDQKIIVYQKEATTIEQLMECVRKIESALLENLADHFQAHVWNDLFTNYFFFKRLSAEKEKFFNKQPSVVFDALRKIVFPKNDLSLKELSGQKQRYLLSLADRYLEYSKQLMIEAKKKIPLINKAIEEKINLLLDEYEPAANSLVEEG